MRLDLNAKRTLGTAVFAGALVFGGGAASAQEVDTYGETPPPEVIDEVETPQGGEPPEVIGEAETPQGGEQPTTGVLGDQVVASDAAAQAGGVAGLPVTGGDLAGLALLGAGAFVTGGALVLHRRRAEA